MRAILPPQLLPVLMPNLYAAIAAQPRFGKTLFKQINPQPQQKRYQYSTG